MTNKENNIPKDKPLDNDIANTENENNKSADINSANDDIENENNPDIVSPINNTNIDTDNKGIDTDVTAENPLPSVNNQADKNDADTSDNDANNVKKDDIIDIVEPIENTDDTIDTEPSDKDIDNNETNIAVTDIPSEDTDIQKTDEENEIVSPANKKSKVKIFAYSFAVIIALIIGYFVFNYLQTQKFEKVLNVDTFYEGIYIDDIYLGGLTKEQALEKVTAQQKEREKEIQVIIKYNGSEYAFNSNDIEIIYDTDVIISRAYDVGRSGTLKSRYYEVMELKDNNKKFGTYRTEDPTPLKERIGEIALSIEKEATEPSVIFTPDGTTDKSTWFAYTDPVPGVKVDTDALWNSVLLEFQDKTYGTVDVPTYEVTPNLNVDLRSLTTEIVSFKSIQSRNSNREHNIALACSMISGTVLMPGEEFSMNDTTGERTKEAGFLEANTIVGGNELVPGIAGGVCQVSGTLFNAAIRADLEITERYHHSFELGYLSRGRDATVNYGTADLKFVNNKETPIYIAMYTKGLEVYAEIYGAPLGNCAYIDLWIKTIDTTPIGKAVVVKDNTVPKGSEPKVLAGHQGIVCEAYKIYRDEDGEQIASELMYTDVYKYYAPEVHIHPDDYEAYVNPTPKVTPSPAPTPPAPDSD